MYTEIAKHYIEVIVPSEEFSSPAACDKPQLLFEPFKSLIAELFTDYNEVNADGDVPVILESFRSHALQSAYYFRGASDIKGGSITAGMHHFGIAVDIVNLIDKNGNKTRDKGESVDWTNIDYVTMRKIARSLGIFDLGSKEYCHFQAIPKINQSQLRHEIYDYVRIWQKTAGLMGDGIVGPKTIAKAKELYL